MTTGSGWPRQVADHVLQQLNELHFGCGLGLLDLRSNVRITSSMGRLRSRFSFTVKSPLFASVTAANPQLHPVRREVFSTSGVACRISSMCCRMRLDSANELPGGVK